MSQDPHSFYDAAYCMCILVPPVHRELVQALKNTQNASAQGQKHLQAWQSQVLHKHLDYTKSLSQTCSCTSHPQGCPQKLPTSPGRQAQSFALGIISTCSAGIGQGGLLDSARCCPKISEEKRAQKIQRLTNTN